VNSSAITARHPEVPNLICVDIIRPRCSCDEFIPIKLPCATLDAQSYMTDKRIVLTTCGSLEGARTIANALVESHLAACVNIIPQIESVYRWKDKIETATEWLLIIKTTENAFNRLRESLGRLHSYDLPECIEIAVEDGSAAYLEWIGESVR